MEILIVEDNQGIAEFIKKVLLKKYNLIVYHASAGQEAYQIALRQDIKIFFIDIGLPDMDGIYLAKKIRMLEQYKCTPIIFETAAGEKEVETYREIEWCLYMIKPFKASKLLEQFKKAQRLTISLRRQSKRLEVKCKQVVHSINMHRIVYIEAYQGGVYIYTAAEDDLHRAYFEKNALYKILGQLDNNFVRCHKRYIIHAEFMSSFEYDYLMLMDRIMISVGREFRAAVKEFIPRWNK